MLRFHHNEFLSVFLIISSRFDVLEGGNLLDPRFRSIRIQGTYVGESDLTVANAIAEDETIMKSMLNEHPKDLDPMGKHARQVTVDRDNAPILRFRNRTLSLCVTELPAICLPNTPLHPGA